MNLFPEEERKENDLYYSYKKEAYEQHEKYVSIRQEVRQLIAGLDGLKLEIAKEILKVERSYNKKVRDEYYKNIFKKYDELISLTNK